MIKINELLIANGQLVAETLRHLANNEIDSDYFAVTSECESYGTEVDCEFAITDYARQAAVTVDQLVAALEAAERERDEAVKQRDESGTRFLKAVQYGAELERERDELQARLTLVREQRDAELNKNTQLEAELARRDAAAGEPYGYVHKSLYEAVGSAGLSNDHEAYRDSPTHIALYTAAQPALLPSEVEELSMLIRRLVHSLKNSNPHSGLLWSVPDYMHKKGYWKENDCLRGEND